MDYSIVIEVANDHDREHVVAIAIDGPNGEHHKEFAVRVPPDTEVEVTPFTDLAPTGIEEFQVTLAVETLDVEPSTWTAEMNECFGRIDLSISSDGSVIDGPVVC